MAKTKLVIKTTYMQYSLSKGKQSGQKSAASARGESFRHFSIFSRFLL